MDEWFWIVINTEWVIGIVISVSVIADAIGKTKGRNG